MSETSVENEVEEEVETVDWVVQNRCKFIQSTVFVCVREAVRVCVFSLKSSSKLCL